MSTHKILIVDDEPDIVEVIEYNLEREGFACVGCGDGKAALRLALSEAPDLIVLDLMLPEMDGLEVCRALKRDPVTQGIAVLMLTARDAEGDVVRGLELGADDYMTKPFSPRVLVARIRAVLRRRERESAASASECVRREGLVIDRARHRFHVDGRLVDLTPTEMRLLHFLASHPGRVFTRDQLLARAIGQQAVVIDRNIDVHVRSLRKKLGPYRDRIETTRGIGYRFHEGSDASPGSGTPRKRPGG